MLYFLHFLILLFSYFSHLIKICCPLRDLIMWQNGSICNSSIHSWLNNIIASYISSFLCMCYSKLGSLLSFQVHRDAKTTEDKEIYISLKVNLGENLELPQNKSLQKESSFWYAKQISRVLSWSSAGFIWHINKSGILQNLESFTLIPKWRLCPFDIFLLYFEIPSTLTLAQSSKKNPQNQNLNTQTFRIALLES